MSVRQHFLAATALGLTLAVTSQNAAFAAERQPLQLPAASVEDSATTNKEPASPKFTAPLLDTPQTVAVIPQQVFLEQGAQNLTEVLRNTPGITFNAGENGFTSGLSNFSMRGFDASGSIFIDDVRDSGNYSRDVFNLEQVEVVKGPTGDNGRGSTGGYVNLVTKTPYLGTAFLGSASLGFDEYDSENRGRVTADLNVPLTDTGALRLNALWLDGGVPGRAVAKRTGWGVAPSVAFGLETPTRFIATYQHTNQDDVPDWGVPGAIIDGMFRYDSTLDAEDIRDNFYGLSSDFDHVVADAITGRIEHDFSSGWSVSNQTRWSRTDRETAYTLATGYTAASKTVTTQRQANARENTSISNQTNVRKYFSTGSLQHTLSAGVEFAHEKSSADRFGAQTNPGGAAISVTDPNPNRAGASTLLPTQIATVKIDTIAGYLYDTVEFSKQWQLTGGVRLERYGVEIDSKTVAGAALGGDNYDLSRTNISGKIGTVYKPAENGSVYAAVGLQAQPPASYLSNPDISREGDNAFPGFSAGLNSAAAKRQYSLNYEVGAKWDFFDRRLNTTVALFRTERKNVPMTGIDSTATPVPTAVTLLGYGKQVVQGIELGAAGQITPDWSILGGIAFMDSKRKHSALLDAGRRLANPGDYGAVLRTSGDELAFSPNVSANLWTTYTLPFGLKIGAGIQYVGDSWVGRPDDAERIIPNGAVGELPGYVILNTMLEYGVTENVSVRLNVDNVTNELYAVSTNWPVQRVLLGPTRNFLLSTQVKF